MIVRLATVADFRAYAGRDLPEWCAEWVGWAGEQDGAVVALGIVSWDKWGRVWAWYDSRAAVSRFLMHRLARRTISHLRNIGVPHLHAYCSERVPDADKWLRRLGFRPALVLPPDPREVWVCDLT